MTSIDALRGLVIVAMIYVNDISGAKHVPWWMKHFSDSFKGSGMTFVDLVFPAFVLFIGHGLRVIAAGKWINRPSSLVCV